MRTTRPVWDVGEGVRRRAGVKFGKAWRQFPELSTDQIELIEKDPFLEVRASAFAQMDMDSMLSETPVVEALPISTPEAGLRATSPGLAPTARRRRRARKG